MSCTAVHWFWTSQCREWVSWLGRQCCKNAPIQLIVKFTIFHCAATELYINSLCKALQCTEGTYCTVYTVRVSQLVRKTMLQECSDGISPRDLFGAKMQKYDDDYHRRQWRWRSWQWRCRTLQTWQGNLMVSPSLTMIVFDVDTNFGFLLTTVSLIICAFFTFWIIFGVFVTFWIVFCGVVTFW